MAPAFYTGKLEELNHRWQDFSVRAYVGSRWGYTGPVHSEEIGNKTFSDSWGAKSQGDPTGLILSVDESHPPSTFCTPHTIIPGRIGAVRSMGAKWDICFILVLMFGEDHPLRSASRMGSRVGRSRLRKRVGRGHW